MAELSRPPVIDVDSRQAEDFINRAGQGSGDNDRQTATTALMQIDRARQALEMASSLDDVKELRNQAEALRIYAKQAQHSLEIQNRCTELKLRAERKAGQMLREQNKNKGAAAADEQERNLPRLEDLGITHSQSSRWQAIALIPEGVFEQHLHKGKLSGQEMTSAAFLRLAEKFKPVEIRPVCTAGQGGAPVDQGLFQAEAVQSLARHPRPVKEQQASPGREDFAQMDFSFVDDWDVNRQIHQAAERLRQGLSKAREGGWRLISRDEAVALVRGLEAALG